jgi:sulfatase maturation enzyme AslB (radical SAM superfamily)
MNIQSVSIVPESVGCNGRCKYCIAAMTPHLNQGKRINLNRLHDALIYAKSGGAQTAIITSKGETLLSQWAFIGQILNSCREENFGQRDMHTNAFLIENRMDEFYSSFIDIKGRLTNITITVASLIPEINNELMGSSYDFKKTLNFLSQDCDLLVRLSCVMNKRGVHDRKTIEDYIKKSKEFGVRAIVFRELWIPRTQNHDTAGETVTSWSRENKVDIGTGERALQEMREEGIAHPIFTLPWGQIVYDVDGVNVVCSTCTENFWESDKGSIKSVVFLPDNHLYSSWEFKGSIIF